MTMNLTRLDPALRKNLKDLLQGYVEHCEVSQHLMARIDFPIYYHGFKFGAPVFTHSGPPNGNEDRKIIGLIGLNNRDSQVASEILLQFIEILTQQPRLADAAILRILPVANPVALELENDAPADGDWPILDHLVSQFHEQAGSGVIEISSGDREVYRLEGEASPLLFAAIEDVRSGVPVDGARSRVLVPETISLNPVSAETRWRLKLTVPNSWTGAPEIHAISRFLTRLLRTHSWLTAGAPSQPRI
jgi:hypothetical protein